MSIKIYSILNYIEHLLILASAIIGCTSISGLLLCLKFVIKNRIEQQLGLKVYAIAAGIKNYPSIIKKEETEPHKIAL